MLFLRLFLALVLTGCLLAGCSGSQETAGDDAPIPTSTKEMAETRIVGDWEGELNALGASLPIVVHISETAGGELSATMDSPSQNAYGLKVSTIAFDGNQLRLEVRSIGGTYVGNLQEGSNTITGKWSQGGQTFGLDLERTDG